MIEVWKPVPGYEGLYEASDFGRIKSLSNRWKKHKILKSDPGSGRYAKVGLYKDGSCLTVSTHVVIAETFLGPCPEGKEVNHINGVKTDNRASNLEYLTHQENIDHSIEFGLFDPHQSRPGRKNVSGGFGSNHHGSKLTESDVIQIRESYSEGNTTHSQLAGAFQVSTGAILKIVKRRTWTHV